MDLQLVLRTCGSPFCGWVAGIANPARPRGQLSRDTSRCGSAWEYRRTSVGLVLWVKGFVDKARSVPQWHEQVLIAERVKDDHFGDRFREQLHRDGLGLNTLHVLREVLMIEADVA